jgi:hypothetical protein
MDLNAEITHFLITARQHLSLTLLALEDLIS